MVTLKFSTYRRQSFPKLCVFALVTGVSVDTHRVVFGALWHPAVVPVAAAAAVEAVAAVRWETKPRCSPAASVVMARRRARQRTRFIASQHRHESETESASRRRR